MILIILAAGTGRRLYPLTRDIPKSLLDLGDGSTLLDKQLSLALKNRSISDIYIVTGYKNKKIEDKIEEYNSQNNIHTVYNPFYDISNNLISLWCTQHLMTKQDFLITNGDNIYKPVVFEKITSELDDGIYVTIDHKDHYDDDDMKVVLSHDVITRVSKKIPSAEAGAESIGFIRVSGLYSRNTFQHHLLKLIREEHGRHAFWLEVFNSMATDGEKIKPLLIGEHDWGEMDFHPDIDQMKKAITEKLF